MVVAENVHSTGIRRARQHIAQYILSIYEYIAAEQNNKRHDFDVDTCFNFSITTVFVCINEIFTKYIQRPYLR